MSRGSSIGQVLLAILCVAAVVLLLSSDISVIINQLPYGEEEYKVQRVYKKESYYPEIKIKKENVSAKNRTFYNITYSFLFENKNITLHYSVPKDLYESAKNSSKYYIYYGKPEEDWKRKYYLSFVNVSEQNKIIDSIIKQLKDYSKNGDETVDLAVAFVQSIEYDWSALNETRPPKFPIETLVDLKGICSDKSLLLASILLRMNYSVALFLFEKEKHLAVGIGCTCKRKYLNTTYCFIETTNIFSIGDVPKETTNVALESTPEIIELGGSKLYSRCKFVDSPVEEYEKYILYLIREFLEEKGLTHDPRLDDSARSDRLPAGYRKGKIWRVELGADRGEEPRVLIERFRRVVKERDELREDLESYGYFGAVLEYSDGKTYLKLLLAR